MVQRRILLIHSGGTIGMIATKNGYKAQKGFFAEYARSNKNLNKNAGANFCVNIDKKEANAYTNACGAVNTTQSMTQSTNMQNVVICENSNDNKKENGENSNMNNSNTNNVTQLHIDSTKNADIDFYCSAVQKSALCSETQSCEYNTIQENVPAAMQNSIETNCESMSSVEMQNNINVQSVVRSAKNKNETNASNATYITPSYIEYDIVELDEIIDSSNAQLQDYYNILQIIKTSYDTYAGFVFLHGTDTMTFASSFISSMIKNLTKPIVFTGSITPMSVKESEGVNNILKSIAYAKSLSCGVYVQFGQLLCNGSKITKVSVDSENAFVGCAGHSYYKSRFGDVYKDLDCTYKQSQLSCEVNKCKAEENEIDILSDGITFFDTKKESNNTKPHFYDKFDDRIAIIKIYPNIKKCIFAEVVKNHRAIILETFGTGNGLGKSKEILDILKLYIEQNNYVVNVSQCLNGFVTNDYEANLCLSQIGVISGKNMTSDALFCHLASILGNYNGKEAQKQIQNLINNW